MRKSNLSWTIAALDEYSSYSKSKISITQEEFEEMLEGQDLSEDALETEFEDVDFTKVCFKDLKLFNLSFTRCDFSEVDFRGCCMTKCRFGSCVFSGAITENVVVDSCIFLNAKDLEFTQSQICYSHFSRNDFFSTKLVALDESVIHEKDYSYDCLAGCRFDDQRFVKCDFSAARLDRAVFINCEFSECIFKDANFSGAQMIGCQFSLCDLDEVDLSVATLDEVKVDIFGMRSFKISDFRLSHEDELTLFISKARDEAVSYPKSKKVLTQEEFEEMLEDQDLSEDALEIEFEDVDFTKVSLKDRELFNLSFTRCDFSRVDFRGCSITKCCFNSCVFSNARIEDVSVENCFFLNTQDLSFTQSQIGDSRFSQCDITFVKSPDWTSFHKMDLEKVQVGDLLLTGKISGRTRSNRE